MKPKIKPLTDDELLAAIAADDEEDAQATGDEQLDQILGRVRSFAELPTIRDLRALWESRGLHPNDPAFLIVETQGLIDARWVSISLELINIIKHVHGSSMDLLHDVKKSAAEVAAVRDVADAFAHQNELLREDLLLTRQALDKFRKTNESLNATTAKAVSIIQNHGSRSLLLNTLIPLVAVGLGFLLASILFYLLGMLSFSH